MTPAKRYPPGVITPAGSWRLLRNRKPHLVYRSYDDSSVFHLMGPLAAPFNDRAQPSISLLDIKGFIPPWKAISQKGATQDGETFVTALYDPLEADLVVEAAGATVADTARVLRDWVAAWDAIKEGELSWFTPDGGRWWAGVRWAKNPVDKLMGGTFRRQKFTWPIKSYDAFWRSYDNVSTFGFAYKLGWDGFDYTTTSELGAGWTVAYNGSTDGWIYASTAGSLGGVSIGYPNGGQVRWHPAGTGLRSAVCRNNAFTSATDNQVISIRLGAMAQPSWPDGAFEAIWGRLTNATLTGVPDGVRLRFGATDLRLSYFKSGTETILAERPLLVAPLAGEWWTLICGYEGNPRRFAVQRGGCQIMTVVESGTGSPMGAANRKAGFGMHAGALPAGGGQVTPASVLEWGGDDNAATTQSGFLTRINCGDQPMFDRYTCFGPGMFSFADGPDSTNMVTFGPLLAGQIAQIRTDPRKRGVVDLSSHPNEPAAVAEYNQALSDYLSFATANNTPPLLQAIESLFGVTPPQGNMYSLLHGRFSDNAAIPPKSPGNPAQIYHVAVGIEGGNADSRIICAGTPLRRWPT